MCACGPVCIVTRASGWDTNDRTMIAGESRPSSARADAWDIDAFTQALQVPPLQIEDIDFGIGSRFVVGETGGSEIEIYPVVNILRLRSIDTELILRHLTDPIVGTNDLYRRRYSLRSVTCAI